MLKIIAIVIVLLIVGVLVLAMTKPGEFQVQRATSIKAPPEKIFALINDFKLWSAWSPWENKDPSMKRTYGASSAGKGAVYEWEGNKEVGKGRMTMTESVPPSTVRLDLDFTAPFEAHNQVEFRIESKGETSEVTWSMRGPTPFLGKIIHVFVNMDKMVGGDFESGLAKLKAAAEK
jgi:uncharacterized protein YndB with AHSA1/START domain